MNPSPVRSRFAGLARLGLALALAAGLAPVPAFADDAAANDAVELFAASSRQSIEGFLAAGNAAALRDTGAHASDGAAAPFANALLPEAFDLRERGVVTPVKMQQPWSTCWSFGAIAAAETSIMSELGITVEDGGIDLSERHLAWLSATPLQDGGSQDGEGTHPLYPERGDWGVLNQGGFPFTATSMFSSGVGPVDEDDAPYRNEQGITIDNPVDGTPICYSQEGDWSVSQDKRFLQAFELEESAVLPSSVRLDPNGGYAGIDWSAVNAMKSELYAGRAVEVAFLADQSTPDDPVQDGYINLDTWAHYTYKVEDANHAAAIVGWDDSYKASNFNAGRQPEGDGAWIVKNSWGAADRPFPHNNTWGIDGSGYFYLSYYDRSIQLSETFDFDVAEFGQGAHYYMVDQYDYLPSKGSTAVSVSGEAAMANVFAAEEDQAVRALSCETTKPNTTATYQVFRLSEASANPRDGELLGTASAVYEHAGYHRIRLEEPCLVRKGERYSVVVELRCAEGYEVVTARDLNKGGVEWEDANSEEGQDFYSVGIVNPGESLLCSGETWVDWSECVAQLQARDAQEAGLANGPYDYDNFPIKAYADPADIPDEPSVVPDPVVPVEPGGGDVPIDRVDGALANVSDSASAPLAPTGDDSGLRASVAAGILGGAVLVACALRRARGSFRFRYVKAS